MFVHILSTYCYIIFFFRYITLWLIDPETNNKTFLFLHTIDLFIYSIKN